MSGKKVLILVLAFVLVATLGLCGLTVFSSYRWFRMNTTGVTFLNNENVEANIVEDQVYPGGDLNAVEIDSHLGAVSVTGYSGDDVEVEISRTAWGADSEDAMQEAEALVIVTEQTGGTLKLSYRQESGDNVVIMGSDRANRVDFTLRVPAGMDVTVTSAGDVDVSDLQGEVSIDSDFGAVTVAGIEGSLTVDSRAASLDVRDVAAGEETINLATEFGSIQMEDISGQEIRVRTVNGELSATGMHADGVISIENSFGPVKVTNFTGAALSVICNNSEITLEDGTAGDRLTVENQFGALNVTGVEADAYQMTNHNGPITLDGARGPLVLENSFGSVTVTNAQNAVLNVRSENGTVTFSGTLDPEKDHVVETRFGEIELTIPGNSAFNVLFETSFGTITSDLPVTVEGSISDERWEGSINGGGPSLQIVNENGGILVKSLE